MEPGSSLLAQSLRECITPVVMVLPTPAVEDSCRKNNLRFLDLLRPFSILDQIDVPVRTASDQPYRLQEFRLRMFYAAEICQPRAEMAEEYLLQVVNDSSDDAFAELPGDPQQLEVVQQMVQSESLSSWFQRYSKEFLRSLAFSEHEAIDHPVACLLVVSTRDANPVNKFVDLFNSDQLPAILNDGVMDPKLLKYYVLLHDNQDGPPDRANEVLSEMKGTFGANECRLLCINSGTPEGSTVEEEFWTSHMVPSMVSRPTEESMDVVNTSLSQPKLGCFLDNNDLSEISEFMLEFSSKQVLPYMEQKIRSLNQQVVATRKGLKNQIKNLWWRKGKEETADVANGSMYTFSSIESQIRVLADYAFMLRDYELALSNYRLLSTDYKTDKAWKHYAGVQEMIGLSLFMLDQSRKEAEYCMESAFSTYQKLGASGQRYSTRCALWWVEMHKARGQYKDAASVFSRAATEEPNLRAGIFLEQAAYCYLRATPPMLRKYGFHLVLAGNRYNVCGQRKHAIRTYMCVLTIYEGQGWNYISDHVHFHLGRLSTFLGRLDVAVQHFMKLIACSHQSPTNQAAFLKEFINVIQNQGSKQEMLKLDLPVINTETLRVHFEDQRTYASPAAAALPEDMWSPVEAGVVPSVPTTVTTWLDAAPKNQPTSGQVNDYNRCIAGEELRVDVEFSNPLQIPVNISAVSLICEFNSENSKEKLGRSKTSKELEDLKGSDSTTYRSLSFRVSSDSQLCRDTGSQDLGGPQTPSIKVSEEAFTLKAGETVLAQLKVVPCEQGVLLIVGVKWTLSGIVTGYRNFAIEGLKKKRLRGRSKNTQENPPHQRLKFHVLKHMPRLEVSLHGMPGKVNTGELHRVVLELSNTSDVAIKSMKFHTSQSGILLVGDPEDLDAEFPSCLEARWTDSSPDKQDSRRNHDLKALANGSIFVFPKGTVLEGGSTLLWPLWLHAREAGTLLLNNILYYEADKTMTDLQYRTVRMSHTLQVLPSLRVSVHITPCLLQLEQYLLRLDIANEHSSESFWLRQVSCMGESWHIAPLLPPVVDCDASGGRIVESNHRDAAFLSASVCPSQLLPAGQTLSLFFQLLDAHTENQRESVLGSMPVSEFTSDVRLGPPSSSEPLIDVTIGPLFNFHVQERFLQERPLTHNQENAEASRVLSAKSSMNLTSKERRVDIILISEQQDESSAEKPAALRDSQRLATHHICHCSAKDSSPLVWVMEGPRTVAHDFSTDPLCEISFYLTIKNCSSSAASVKVETTSLSSPLAANASPEVSKPVQGNQAGWFDLSLETPANGIAASGIASEILDLPDSSKDEEKTQESITPAAPFIWCSLSSFRIKELEGGASERFPLHVTVFAPGVYDLSGYQVSWQLFPKCSNVVRSTKREETISLATPITRSSSFVAPLIEQITIGNAESNGGTAEAAAGFGSGHPLILTVQAKEH